MRSSIARWGAVCLFLASLVSGGAARAVPAQPNDPGFPLQWNLQMVGAPAGWAHGTGLGITIAVVDSGVDLTHPDLKDKVIGHVNCVGSGGDESKCVDGGQDDNGHGTHVAGIAAGITNNATGIAGVAPDAAILDVKVLSQSCDPVTGCDATGTTDDVAAGIKYAADHGAAVINLSLGNASQSLFGPAFQDAIDYAFNKEPDGAIPVIAAGNDYVLPSGGALNAIVVGALDKDGSKSQYANSIGDAQWALMAPGGEPDTKESCESSPAGVLSTYLDGGYACLAGTSMAAPHVSGAAAVLRGMGLTKQQTIDRLLGTAKKIEPAAMYGAGELDIAAAVAGPPAAPPPSSEPADQSGMSAGPASATDLPSDATTTTVSPSPASASAAPPSGDLTGPTSTAPAGVISLPNQRAAGSASGGVTVHTPGKSNNISAGLVAAAVALAAGVSAAVGLFFLRGSSWTRRTPRPRPPE